MTRLPLIYIAGPFRGPTPLDVRRNVERARDAGLLVAQLGAYPIIPHTMTAEFDKQLDDQFWLDGTMEMLRRCDALLLIPYWDQSTGARAEAQYARMVTLPIFDVYHGNWQAQVKTFVAEWQLSADRRLEARA